VEQKPETEIDRLALLQDLDRQLKEKEDRVTALKTALQELEQQGRQQREQLAGMCAERDGLEAQRRDLEAILERESSRIRDNRMRMNRARNERELLALQHEVNVAKETNQQIEEQFIAILERLEDLNKRIGESEETLRVFDSESEKQIGERNAEAQALVAEIAAERVYRDEVAEGLSVLLRGRYEQIFARRGGTAVVEVRNGTCLGCHMNVPPQLYNELQKFREVRQCPNCHRILYWRAEPQIEGPGASG
jgi:hypothetical protein